LRTCAGPAATSAARAAPFSSWLVGVLAPAAPCRARGADGGRRLHGLPGGGLACAAELRHLSCAENTGHARVRSPCATALTRNNTVHVCTRDIARTSASDRGWREQLRTRKLELWLSSGGLASMPTLPLRASRPSARPWRRYGPSKHSQKRTSSVVLSRRWCQAGRCPPRSPA